MTRPTPELKAAIVADRRAGMTHVELEEKYGVSRSSVKRWTTGVVPEVPIERKPSPVVAHSPEKRRSILDEHYASGRTVNASADLHGISRSTLKRWVDKDDAWRMDEGEIDMTAGEWVLCPRRRIQVWRPAA